MNSKRISSSLIKTILVLAWPTMLEELLETAVSYIDAAMVGRLGAKATAAIGCTQTVNWLLGSMVFASGIGFLTYISHELGAERPDNARKAAAQVSLIILLLGSLITIISLSLARCIPLWMHADPDIRSDASTYFFIVYIPMIARAATTLYGSCLRAAGDTRTPLRVTFAVNIINIVLNFFLIYPTRILTVAGHSFSVFGMGMGVTGAAVASSVSFFIGGIGMTIAVFRHPLISPRGLSLRPDIRILRPVFRISAPCILQRIFTSSGYVVFASMINGIGTVATATHSIANTAESAFYIPGYGMQTAASTLSGNCWGEGSDEHLLQMTRMLIFIEFVLMTITGTLLFVTARPLMGMFTADPDVIDLGSKVLRMVAVSEPAFGFTIILNGIFQGVGDTKPLFVFDISCMWGVRIEGTFLFVRLLGYGLISAWACMIAHNVLLAFLLLRRYALGKWNPFVTGRKLH